MYGGGWGVAGRGEAVGREEGGVSGGDVRVFAEVDERLGDFQLTGMTVTCGRMTMLQ